MEYAPDRPWYMRLHWQVLIAMILGISVGLLPGGEVVEYYVGWVGSLFMRLLRMIILPLVITSIVSGVASAGSGRTVGRMFGKTLGYYLVSSLLAALTGLLLFNIINPGRGYPVTDTGAPAPELATPSSIDDLINTIVPENFFEAASAGEMLMVIFFCILFGAAVTTLPENPRAKITGLVDALFKAMMSLTTGIIKLLPNRGLRTVAHHGHHHGSGVIPQPRQVRRGAGLGPRNPLLHHTPAPAVLLGACVSVDAHDEHARASAGRVFDQFLGRHPAGHHEDGEGEGRCIPARVVVHAADGRHGEHGRHGGDGVRGERSSSRRRWEPTSGSGRRSSSFSRPCWRRFGAAAVPSAGLVVIFIILGAIGIGDNPQAMLIVAAMLSIDRPLDMCRTAVNVYSDSCAAAVVGKWEGEEGIDEEIRM